MARQVSSWLCGILLWYLYSRWLFPSTGRQIVSYTLEPPRRPQWPLLKAARGDDALHYTYNQIIIITSPQTLKHICEHVRAQSAKVSEQLSLVRVELLLLWVVGWFATTFRPEPGVKHSFYAGQETSRYMLNAARFEGPLLKRLNHRAWMSLRAVFTVVLWNPISAKWGPSAWPDERKEKVRHQMLCYTKRAKYNKCWLMMTPNEPWIVSGLCVCSGGQCLQRASVVFFEHCEISSL